MSDTLSSSCMCCRFGVSCIALKMRLRSSSGTSVYSVSWRKNSLDRMLVLQLHLSFRSCKAPWHHSGLANQSFSKLSVMAVCAESGSPMTSPSFSSILRSTPSWCFLPAFIPSTELSTFRHFLSLRKSSLTLMLRLIRLLYSLLCEP